MFTVTVDDAMLARLREMLEDEDDGVRVRLREYKHGGGCHAKFILGLGMDEPDEEEDICIDIGCQGFSGQVRQTLQPWLQRQPRSAAGSSGCLA